MSWNAWWCGWACCATAQALLNQRWGWAAFGAAFAALYARRAHRDHAKATTVPMDSHTAAIAAGFLYIKPDEVATVEVVTRTGEQARFSVWRNT